MGVEKSSFVKVIFVEIDNGKISIFVIDNYGARSEFLETS